MRCLACGSLDYPVRMFTEDEVREVLAAKVRQVDSLIRTDGGQDLAFAASTVISIASELGIELGTPQDGGGS